MVASDTGRPDAEIFTSYVRDHDRSLRRLAYRMLGGRHEMDDALQEAYCRAFESYGGFRVGAEVSTWRYRIAYTTCIVAIRRRRRLVPVDAVVIGSSPDPGDACDVDADSWTEVDQGDMAPPAPGSVSSPDIHDQLMGYDPAADRFVFYLSRQDHPAPTETAETWAFDPRAGRWQRMAASTPQTPVGWGASGEGMVFDESAGRVIVASRWMVAAYDAGADDWDLLQESDLEAIDSRYWHALDCDSLNGRIVVFGGVGAQSTEPSGALSDVRAYDTQRGEWIDFLPAAGGESDTPGFEEVDG
jgi:RNA polymerase sigma factor (sigma-70 family)